VKEDYLDIIKWAGFEDVRIVSESSYDVDVSGELIGKITSIQVETYK